jgi:hypothetical protein
VRGHNIGRKLDMMTRSRKGKLPLVIEPRKKRPNSVMIATKFATECNITVRGHVPIFPLEGIQERRVYTIDTRFHKKSLCKCSNLPISIVYFQPILSIQKQVSMMLFTAVQVLDGFNRSPSEESMCGYAEESCSPAAL